MKITVLDRAAIGFDLPIDKFSEFGELTVYDQTSGEEAPARVCDADVIVLNKVKITREVIAAAKKLKLICVFATGFDNVDVASARERGIAVCNVPAYSTDSVVLFTVATALAIYAKLPTFSKYTKSGDYTASGAPNLLTPVYNDLNGKTWGIVGYGNIGKGVAKVAQALGARVVAYKRTPTDEVECLSLDELLSVSDIVTLHVPLNADTAGLIDERRLSLMKNNAILVNEARGGIIDEHALTEAVINGKLGGYGCDVYSNEPFDKRHPYNKLLGLENVILTPHCAWASYEARCRCLDIIFNNISAFNRGEILNRVDISRQN